VKEAGEYLEQQSAKSEEVGDSDAAVTIYNELEGFWRAAGQKEKSYSAAEKALALLRSLGHDEGIDYATTLLNYATAMMVFGEAQNALAVYRNVEEIYEAQLQPDDYRYASLYNNMAQALLRSRDMKIAGEYFSRSLKLLEKMGDVESEKATCCCNMAVCLMAQGGMNEARAYLERAEEAFRSLPNDPHADSMLACRGQLEYLSANYAAAAGYYQRAAENIEKRFGRNVNYAVMCRNCSKALTAAGNETEAERWAGLAAAAGR
jgi:tetratricopeptide (TPR) repeat protein